ncbi:hypothetical protein AYX15_07069 [Cryptococcus neoformans]|nr:hypothetical protein AYX15_07069 [Cryptococcus neoformans var. grubii]
MFQILAYTVVPFAPNENYVHAGFITGKIGDEEPWIRLSKSLSSVLINELRFSNSSTAYSLTVGAPPHVPFDIILFRLD